MSKKYECVCQNCAHILQSADGHENGTKCSETLTHWGCTHCNHDGWARDPSSCPYCGWSGLILSGQKTCQGTVTCRAYG